VRACVGGSNAHMPVTGMGGWADGRMYVHPAAGHRRQLWRIIMGVPAGVTGALNHQSSDPEMARSPDGKFPSLYLESAP
jgi:hypothetical protein